MAPQRVILGNAAGFRWLAAYFNWLAARSPAVADAPEWDPGDHVHLCDAPVPCNFRLSDEADWLFLTLTAGNRRAVLRRYRVLPRHRMKGSPIRQFCTFLQHFQQNWISCGRAFFDDPDQIVEELESLQREVQTALAAARASGRPKGL